MIDKENAILTAMCLDLDANMLYQWNELVLLYTPEIPLAFSDEDKPQFSTEYLFSIFIACEIYLAIMRERELKNDHFYPFELYYIDKDSYYLHLGHLYNCKHI